MNQPTDKARFLRGRMTVVEKKLWISLRAKRFAGFKFRRQAPIGPFIVDFVCFEHKLIIELDGPYHTKTQEYDQARTKWLETNGFKILRFWNDNIYEKLDYVMDKVMESLEC
ncbi:endonuclease domain-containing protein [bacterium]|nr:endonuclease domain-containing protein [bacterium]